MHNWFKCKICNKEFGLRIYKSHLKDCHNLNDSKEYLLSLGFNNKCEVCGNETTILNLNDGFRKCCRKCGSKTDDAKEQRKRTNLERYGSTTPAGNVDIIKKQQKTIFDKFGCHHLSLKETQDKRKATCLEKYGFDNVTKSDHYKDSLFNMVKDKTELITGDKFISYDMDHRTLKCKDCGSEYEVHRHLLSYRESNKQIFCTTCNPLHTTNTLQLEIFNFIKCYCADVIENTRRVISPLELDIFIPSKNVAIEFNGLEWHSSKRVESDYHLKKTNACESIGIHLIHIYEDDWLYKRNIVESRLKSIFGISSNKIFARKCIIKDITNDETKKFLDANHMQGGGVNSKYRYGLMYNDELVAVMTFGQSRFEKGKIELHRFANKLDSNVVGGASRLFKHFLNTINPVEIISYADRSWSRGHLYETLGFELVSAGLPNYSYVIGKHRSERFKHRKSELVKLGFDSTKTEIEIMSERGYFRIFDSGSLKYKYGKHFSLYK